MDKSTAYKRDPSSREDSKRRFFYGYVIVIASFLIVMVVFGAQFSYGVFFKPLLAEFGWSRAVTSGAYSLYMVMQGVWGVFAGRLSDRFGPRLVTTVFGLFLGLGYMLMSQVNAAWQVYVVYGIVTSASSACWIPLLSSAARWFVRRVGLVSGIIASGVGLGALVIAPLANELIYRYGWRDCYLIVGAAGLIVIVAASQFLKAEPGDVGQFPDGTVEPKRGDLARGVTDISPEDAIGTRQFWLISGVLFTLGFCVQIVVVHIVPHSIDIGMSAAAAASVLAFSSGFSIVGRVGFGGVGDRIGSRSVLVYAMALVSISFVWLLFASQLWSLYIFAIVFSIGYGGLVAVQSPLLAEFFGMKALGGVLGLTSTAICAGGALGPFIAGYLFDRTASYNLVFVMSAALGVASVITAWKLRPIIK